MFQDTERRSFGAVWCEKIHDDWGSDAYWTWGVDSRSHLTGSTCPVTWAQPVRWTEYNLCCNTDGTFDPDCEPQ